MNKIVIGKPVTTGDASNTGWMDKNALATAVRLNIQLVVV